MWKVRVLQKHPHQMSFRQFAPPAFAALGATLGIMALLTSIGDAALVALMATYFAIALVASFLAAWRTRPRLILVLPIVYATLHLSYGLGFLVGLVRFFNRWHIDSRADRSSIGDPMR